MLRLVACACACALLCAGAGAEIVVYTQQVPRTIAEEFRDMPASFGDDLPGDGLRGFLVRGNPPDGCSAMEKPPVDTENFTGKWIVLIARYNCSFEVKVRNAQAAGFDCAIVHNVNSSELETMSAKDPDGIVIPSVFVSDLAGLILAEEYLYTSGFYIMVNGDLPFNINTHLLLPFAIVVVLCLIVILIFMIVKCIKDRRRARRHRLPNRCLRKIPTCKFSKGDPYDTCAICLDDYLEGERLRVLPCAHAYHAKCIDPWLTQNRRVCPVCKRRVLAAGERERDHSDSDEEPLLGAGGAGGAGAPAAGAAAGAGRRTQGGTFEEQSENPFRRAARLMSRHLRSRQPQEVASPLDEEAVEENVEEDDRAPLVQSAPAAVHAGQAERGPAGPGGRRRGQGRARRSRSARRAPAPAPAAPAAPAVSINGDAGEIGVAALPAAAAQPAAPHLHV